MKEGFDKEIDSLLRRRARGAAWVREGVDGARAPDAGAHLDADELGAFAEGALPAAARFAAVSHIADCDECRASVVGLARVSEVGAELEKHAAPASVGATGFAAWRAWTASLFSPRVLRFAAPALALSVVAVVSFVALRSKNGTESGAMQVATREGRRDAPSRNQSGDAALSTADSANASANVASTQTTDDASHGPASANTSAPPPTGRGHGAAEAPAAATETQDGAPAPPPPPAAASGEGAREIAKAEPRPVEEGETAKSDDVKTENREKPARRAEPTDEVTSNDQPEQQQKRSGQSRANEAQMPDGSRNQTRGSTGNTASNAVGGGLAASAPRAADRDGGSSTTSRAPASKRGHTTSVDGADENDSFRLVEGSRSAAGHRFRREGGSWVDVNYRPSMSSTGVQRGTEAFRALVADIPEIGRVAEQLGGEVVIVVRGHAYRVR